MTKTISIHQLIPSFSVGDAIGNHALAIRKALAGDGYGSTVFAGAAHESLRSLCRPIRDLPGSVGERDVLLFHFSLGREAIDAFAAFPGRRVLVYHNITPAEYFDGVNSRVARQCREGREALERLAEVADLALGVSEYNRKDLEAAGFKKTGILPIAVEGGRADGRADPSRLRQFDDGFVNVLHVGRIAPNKKIEDLLKIHYFFAKVRPLSRLILAGTECDTESYGFALREMAAALHLQNVLFLGHVSDAELAACYRRAHVYVGMSEHEGFCVPIVEAMMRNVPVVAYAAGGVPETLGDGGVLVRKKKFPEIAELLDLVIRDRPLRERLVLMGRKRANAFSLDALRVCLRRHLAEVSE